MMKKTLTIEGMRTRVLSLFVQGVFLFSLPLMVNGQDCLTIDCSTAGPQNQLANPSFETNAVHDAIGAQDWQVFFDAWGSVRVFNANTNPSANAQDGNFFIKMFGPNSGLFQDFPVSPGDNITGSVYMQNASFDATLPSGSGQVKLEWLGVPGAATSPLFTSALPQNVWTEFSVNAVAPAGATGVRFVLVSNQPFGGAIMFDNASLINSSTSGSGLVGNVSVSNDPGACGAELALATPATGGDCNVVSITNDYTGTDNASGFYPIGTTTVNWTATATEPLPDIALLSATGGVPNAEEDIVAKLTATGAFNSISTINVRLIDGITPTLATLQQYDAVLVWNDDPFANAIALGDVLADYVDAGGGVVVSMFTQFSPSILDLEGDFRNNGYLPLDGPSGLNTSNDGPIGMNIIDGTHPIMQGVVTFNGGIDSFRGTGTSLQSGASLLANWSTGQPLIAYKEPTSGRTVSLNFYPPSSDARFDLWDASTDGDVIMANSLLWAAGYEGTVSTATCSVDITVNDTEAPTLDCGAGINSGNVLNAAGFEDAAGDNTQYNSPSWTSFSIQPPFALNIPPVQEGNFYVKLSGANSSLSQSHPVEAGDEIDASVFIKSASFDAMQPACEAYIKLEYNNGVVVESAPVNGTIPIDTWTQITLSDVAPEGATSVSYVAMMGCPQVGAINGAVMFDDASMSIISAGDGLIGDVTVDNDPGACGAQLTLAVPTSGDNCPGATLTNDYNETGDASDFYPVGTTTVNWTVTDAAGLTSTCSVDVTVNDTEDPTITCPADLTVYTDENSCDATGVELGTPTTSDNCSGELASNNSTGIYSLGTNEVVWTVVDASGNEATCIQTVTVLDDPTVSISSPEDAIDGELDDVVTIYFGTASLLDVLGVTDMANLISALDADCPNAVSYQWQYQNLGEGTTPIDGEWIDTLGTSADIVINASGVHDFHHAYRVVITNTADETSASNYIRVYSIDTRCKNADKVKVCMVPNGNPDNAHEICININAVDAILENSPGSFLGACDPVLKSSADLPADFEIFPNPTRSTLNIEYMPYVSSDVRIELYNSTGQLMMVVFNGPTEAESVYRSSVDMREFSDGMYLVRLIDSQGARTLRLVVTK